MTNEELINIVVKIKSENNISDDNLNRFLKNRYKDIYDEIVSKTNELNKFKRIRNGKELDVSIKERLYCLKNNLNDRPKCSTCGKNYVKFIVHENRYSSFCCVSCSSRNKESIDKVKKTKLERYGSETYNNKEKSKQTRINKYGSYHKKDFVEKVKATKLINFGSETFVNTEKCKQTKFERYGDENFVNVDKIKQTKLERYNDENYNNSEKISETKQNFSKERNKEINEKRKKTNIEKFGVEYNTQNPEVLKKIITTNLKRYGYSSILKRPDIIERSIKATKEKSWNYIISNSEYTPLFTKEEYINNRTNETVFKWKHNKCGIEFESSYDRGTHKPCPTCYKENYNSGFSIVEKQFLSTIQSIYNGNIIENTRNVIPPYELDIYIPEKKIAFEFDGLYWHSDNALNSSDYHLYKTELCEKNGIHLIHIFENEWLNKQKIVISRIKNLFGIYDKTIYARNCVVKEISSEVSKNFQNENHIQLSVNCSINIGLFFENELVSIMTFSKTRLSKKYEYELVRFCNKLGYHIPGSAGKLLKYFERTYKPKSLISYADRRWTMNDGSSVYDKLQFKMDHISKPNYWYFKSSNGVLYSRLKFQKHKLKNILPVYSEELTESENMKKNGYKRIFDCGNLVFIKKYYSYV